MIEFAIGAVAGAVAVKAFPVVDRLATQVRDWLYSFFRKAPPAPDDSDKAGA